MEKPSGNWEPKNPRMEQFHVQGAAEASQAPMVFSWPCGPTFQVRQWIGLRENLQETMDFPIFP